MTPFWKRPELRGMVSRSPFFDDVPQLDWDCPFRLGFGWLLRLFGAVLLPSGKVLLCLVLMLLWDLL